MTVLVLLVLGYGLYSLCNTAAKHPEATEGLGRLLLRAFKK